MFLPDVFAGLTKEQLAQLRIHRSGESVPLLETVSESLAMQVGARLQVIPFRANQGESWAIPWEKSPVKEIPLRWVDIDRSLQSQTQITGQLSNVTEPDLLEHLKKRQEIRHSGGAEITRSEEFTRQEVMRDPEKGERWANALRDAVQAYSGETGISPDILTRMANDMTKAVERARNPEIGDLVRADPRGDDHLRTPFAGRVIAKLDTSGGDFRYHLRAQTGPDEGMEATFYGRENDFRAVPLEQANGFVRKTQQSAEEAFQSFHEELPEKVAGFLQQMENRFTVLDPTDEIAFAEAVKESKAQARATMGLSDEHPLMPEVYKSLEESNGLTDEQKDSVQQEGLRVIQEERKILEAGMRKINKEIIETNLRKKGQELLQPENADKLDQRKLVAACYWKHGIHAGPMIDKILQAVENRDYETLEQWVLNKSNVATQEAFSRLTGINLGNTEKKRLQQLKDWVGTDAVEAIQAKREAQEEQARAQSLRENLQKAFSDLSSFYVQVSDDQSISAKDCVLQKIQQGYRTIGSYKKGVAVYQRLCNEDNGQWISLKDKRFQTFLKAALAIDSSSDLPSAMKKAELQFSEYQIDKPSATQAEMETLVRELQRQGQDTACDLTAALRAKNIDCRMDHEQIDGLFYLPIKDSVRVLPESEPLPDDVTAFASIPGVGKLVLPKKAVQEYLASQWATCLDPEKTESSAMENSDSFPNP
ncbi:hypothetical protein AB4090_05105 [Acidithiobacillus sp. IBUN Pt1247-S3]|uniref:hypothetical protein n=1 Tax=Acidithiobacillus sp. IBUN Pt1247-S3 TaxID=3166642 RepID=UPI0034E4135F